MSLANNLMEILEIAEIPITGPVTIPPVVVERPLETGNQVVDDLDFARNNIRDLIDTGTLSLKELTTIAKSTEHPRAYEVLSTLLNTVVNLNKELIDIHKKKKDLFKEEPVAEKQGTTNLKVNQAVFVGSTSDLAKIVKSERESANVITNDIPQ